MALVEPINNFEGNAGSFRKGKNHGAAPPAVTHGATPAAFRKFMDSRKGADAKGPTAPVEKPIEPTSERLDKGDVRRRTKSGTWVSQNPVERLLDQGKLDPTPHIGVGMFLAAEQLYLHFRESGLRGIAAQDLTRVTGGGGTASSGFPGNEKLMHHRQKFREATRIMGWYVDAPYRGAGRLVVDVVCYEVGVKEAALVHIPGSRAETNLAAGMDRLREGLFALATHWNTFASTHCRIRAARDLLPGAAS